MVTTLDFMLVGNYNGNPGHQVQVQQYNYNTTAWTVLGTLPHNVAEQNYQMTMVDDANYLSGGQMKIRIIHNTAGNASHNLYIDHMYLAFVGSESSSPSRSPSSSPSASPSSSASASPSPSSSESRSPSSSESRSPSLSESRSESMSESPSPSLSPSASISFSPSASESRSASLSPSASASPTPSSSESRSASLSPSFSPSASQSPSSSQSATPSPSPSASESSSPSSSQSATPSSSPSASESLSPSHSQSPSPSRSVSASISPSQAPGSGLYSYEAFNTLPITNDELEIPYGAEDDIAVSADDESYVPVTGSTTYLAHEFKKVNNTNQDSIKILVNLKSSLSGSTQPIYLQVWNETDQVWETIATDSTVLANTDVDMTYTISANQTKYYDSSYTVTFRVWQETGGGSETLSIDYVNICFIIVYEDQFSSQGNTYEDVYSSQGNTYEDVYTNKRC